MIVAPALPRLARYDVFEILMVYNSKLLQLFKKKQVDISIRVPIWKHFEYILYAAKSRKADMFSSKLPVSQVYLQNLWKLLTRLIRTPRP